MTTQPDDLTRIPIPAHLIARIPVQIRALAGEAPSPESERQRRLIGEARRGVPSALVQVDAAYPHLLQRNTYQTDTEYCYRVCQHLNNGNLTGPWGLLSKSDGESGYTWSNGVRTSHDAIVNRDTGLQVDIIIAAGNGQATSPSWGEIERHLYRPHNKYVHLKDIPLASGGGGNVEPIKPPVVKPCPDPSAHLPKPPVQVDPGEMMDEAQRLDAFYSDKDKGLGRDNGLSINGRPDWEGVGAWLLGEYLNARLRGESREAARKRYEDKIRESHEWKSRHR